ncbi:centrosomal protein of 295 kDa isoform X1 [Notechis scutatus]|uniref:Centrosomal protein of 295 kDa isoform X1 n=1 Tax=Notechis scutatus TaxID=8663 RepID=A0A6J1UZ60_9SAUR|nr:centrosomal protein of 295 kDa isoform X1 [Notechis scutatus]XP_026535705.1 centrosomal protein of 295 kDa isoform X1 [Notechis scutatus]
MRRKVAGRLRLSPNEEAQLLKEEHERRRKLRLQQVRQQERNIALQIRQDVKQRRDEHLKQLAEELESEWQKTQDEKIKALENLYLSSLRAIGEGHKEAKENEPDLEALAKQAEERKEAAKKRYKEALKKQKSQKEKSLREQTRRANARKHAFEVEKERATRVASLPPPPPHPFENIELKNLPAVKISDVDNFSISRHHIFDPHVDREMSTEQPDARLLAKEEAKQKEELQNDKERERREQMEKAYLRGKHALKMVRLARDKEKLMEELEQMQNVDLAHRRKIVAQMPPQLFEPSYRRVEIKGEWQRELECAFEDMYTGNMKMKGDLILHLDPQPLPALSEASQDDELELSQEPEPVCELSPKLANEIRNNEPSGSEVETMCQPSAKLALKKLLNKIRNQKDNWTSRCESEVQSDLGTIESGTISNGGEKVDGLASVPEPESNQDPGVEPSEELPEILDHTIVAGNELIKQVQDQTTKIRKELERFTQTEQQQQQQTTEQKIQLEIDFLKTKVQQHYEQEAKTDQEKKEQECQTERKVFEPVVHQKQEAEYKADIALEPQVSWFPKEDDHLKRIHDCQQRLLVQNRMHQESVDEARRKLEEYQNKLQQRFQSVSRGLLNPLDRFAHLNALPDPLSQAQELHQPRRIKATAYKPPEKVSGQELAPSWQKIEEQRLEVASDEQAQPRVDSEKQMQINQRCFYLAQGSSSHQEKEKMDVWGTPVAHSLEFHKMPGSLLPKSEDTSVTTQSVARIPNARFVLPAGDAPGPSESLLCVAPTPDKPPAEKILLPTLKHQDIPGENRINTVSNQSHCLPLHSTSLSPPPTTDRIQGIQESSSASRKGRGVLSGCSDIVELRDHLLASSESIEVQQEHLKELQGRLDEERETLLFRQKIQEDVLLQRHAQLKQKMEQQQEALKEIIKRVTQLRPCGDMTEAKPDSLSLLSVLLNEAEDGNPKQVHFDDMNIHAEDDPLFPKVNSVEQTGPFQSTWTREEKQRLSKPPLVKVKPGLDLKQHELSAIQELDTPRSDRFSTTEISGYKEHLTGDIFLTPQIDKLRSSKSPAESLQEEIDLLRTISMADDKEFDFGQSLERIQGSSHDESMWKANGLYYSVHSKEFTSVDRHLSNYPAENGRKVTSPDPSLRPNSQVTLSNAWSPGLLTPTTCTQQVASGYFSSVTPSAANFIKNYNIDDSLAGKESCAAKQQTSLFSFPAKESSNAPSFIQKSDDSSEHPSSRLPFEEMEYNGSKIQQIINKYRKDFSWSSLSNVSSGHDPAVGLDATDIERNFPNFHRELFQPLKPSSDFDISSTLSQCRISHSSKDLSKVSDLSKSQDLTSSTIEEGRNSTLFISRGNLSNFHLKEQNDERVNQPRQAVHLAAEELSERLSLESTLHNSFSGSGAFGFNPEENRELSKDCVEGRVVLSPETGSCEALQDDNNFRYFCSSIENFRSLIPVEDQTSMYEMIPSFGPRKSTHERTELAKEDTSSTTESLCFVELPTASFNKNNETGTRNRLIESDIAHYALNSTQEQRFPKSKELLGWPQEMNSGNPFQNSAEENVSQPAMFPQLNMDAIQAKSVDSHLSQCSIPVWETLTGRGIMEEPDLTLVSSNDISTAESELIPGVHLEVKDSPQSRGFLPLNPEVDEFFTQLDYPSVTPGPLNDPDENYKPRGVILSPVHGTLQESFLKQKKDFIERSLKRVEKLKHREQSSEKTQSKELPLKKPQLHKRKVNRALHGAAVDLLKKVEEKRCSPLDRKEAVAQMQQRTSRLYNNLAEVKNRKEEKDRKENYAKNRERAKEFQKKTLEKLRARKINLKT